MTLITEKNVTVERVEPWLHFKVAYLKVLKIYVPFDVSQTYECIICKNSISSMSTAGKVNCACAWCSLLKYTEKSPELLIMW